MAKPFAAKYPFALLLLCMSLAGISAGAQTPPGSPEAIALPSEPASSTQDQAPKRTGTNIPMRPTRMQLCQRELGEASDQLVACLNQRMRAEDAAERKCRRSSNQLKGGSAQESQDLRSTALSSCLDTALIRPYKTLEVGPAKPRSTASTGNAGSPSDSAQASKTPAKTGTATKPDSTTTPQKRPGSTRPEETSAPAPKTAAATQTAGKQARWDAQDEHKNTPRTGNTKVATDEPDKKARRQTAETTPPARAKATTDKARPASTESGKTSAERERDRGKDTSPTQRTSGSSGKAKPPQEALGTRDSAASAREKTNKAPSPTPDKAGGSGTARDTPGKRPQGQTTSDRAKTTEDKRSTASASPDTHARAASKPPAEPKTRLNAKEPADKGSQAGAASRKADAASPPSGNTKARDGKATQSDKTAPASTRRSSPAETARQPQGQKDKDRAAASRAGSQKEK